MLNFLYFLFQKVANLILFTKYPFFSHKRPKYQNNQHQFPISISKTLFSVLNIFYFLLFRIYKEAKRHRAAIRFRLNGFPKTHKFFSNIFPKTHKFFCDPFSNTFILQSSEILCNSHFSLCNISIGFQKHWCHMTFLTIFAIFQIAYMLCCNISNISHGLLQYFSIIIIIVLIIIITNIIIVMVITFSPPYLKLSSSSSQSS